MRGRGAWLRGAWLRGGRDNELTSMRNMRCVQVKVRVGLLLVHREGWAASQEGNWEANQVRRGITRQVGK